MKKYFIVLVGLFFVIFTAVYCFADSSEGQIYARARRHRRLAEENNEGFKPSGNLEKGVRVINVKASKYKFEPDPIIVKLGEKVRLVVSSTDVAHGLAISEFNVNLSVPAGKTESVEFVADKKGTFHAHCSVYCGQGHAQQQATFIVK